MPLCSPFLFKKYVLVKETEIISHRVTSYKKRLIHYSRRCQPCILFGGNLLIKFCLCIRNKPDIVPTGGTFTNRCLIVLIVCRSFEIIVYKVSQKFKGQFTNSKMKADSFQLLIRLDFAPEASEIKLYLE